MLTTVYEQHLRNSGITLKTMEQHVESGTDMDFWKRDIRACDMKSHIDEAYLENMNGC